MIRLQKLIAPIIGIALLGLSTPANAEYRALLIGASKFPNAPGISSLDGPVNDVESLRAELIANWKVPAQNIVVLLNETATRRQILLELAALADRAASGDTVIVYYSGHGTSAHDRSSNLRLDLSTGAIVPSDIRQTGNPKDLIDQLIVGVRDVRPNLAKMDQKGARVLVLFDACYSGDSAKSIGELRPRNADFLIDSIVVAPEGLTAFNQAIADADKAPSDWPYRNVVYLSASARNEVAYDISNSAARNDRPTIDGKAHGAFTNAVLKGLRGAGDTNHDGQISYVELHGYLVRQLQRDGQTPQLHPQDTASVRQPVIGVVSNAPVPSVPNGSVAAAPPASAPPPAAGPPAPAPRVDTDATVKLVPLRVRMATPEQALQARLAALRGVQVVNGQYDLEIVGRAPRFRLMHSGGTPVTPNILGDEEIVRIIRQQATAHQLTNIPFAAQDFNLEVSMNPDQGAYHLGERTQIGLRTERDAWLLAFNVDVEGNVYLVYPARPADAQKIAAGTTLPVVEVQASEPTGTEIIHAFGFSEKPAIYDELLQSVRLSESQVRNLTDTLARDAGKPGRSQAQRITYTSKN